MSSEQKRVVIVTGGAYGIGRAIVRRFAQEGAAVLIADRDRPRGEALAEELNTRNFSTLFFEADLREISSIEKMIERAREEWGGLDVLCNNAGVEINRRADQFSLDDWNAMLDTNLRAAFLGSKYAYPLLEQRKGCIINIASIQGLACEGNTAVYASTKGGLIALTRGMAIDFAPNGVRVNAICPGAVHTGMMEKYVQGAPEASNVLEELGSKIPMRRIAKPEEIAGVAYFLASPDASYVTGAAFVVDGGLLAKLAT